MPNPIEVAIKGKGFFSMMARGRNISRRYGLTAIKIDRALSQLTSILQEIDCQATLPITATALSRNQELVKRVQAQGLELAVHGYSHCDYTQLSREQQCEHLRRACQIFEQAGVSFTGFRCPYLRWNTDILRVLSEFGFTYDSSQAIAWDVVGGVNTDAYQHALGFYGAQMATENLSLPHLEGNLVRIPYCLPDDEALVERLKLPDIQTISEIWLAMLDRIYNAGELFTLGIHPERISVCEGALRAVLVKARSLSPAVWIARLEEIAKWYNNLGQTTFETQPHIGGGTRVCVHSPNGGTLLARYVDVQAQKITWARGYEQILCNEFIFEGEQHPWIGLPPDSPISLRSFLQHQGYLVEISPNPTGFSFYFQQKSFKPEEERLILAALETSHQPLLRLGRWPGGAQAALAVTGDVDAFTLWDYGLRILDR